MVIDSINSIHENYKSLDSTEMNFDQKMILLCIDLSQKALDKGDLPFGSVITKNGLNFQLGFGRSIGRSYRIYNEKVSLGLPLFNFGDSRTQLNADFSDSWFFKATVFYRFGL